MMGFKSVLEVTEHGQAVDMTWDSGLPQMALCDALDVAHRHGGLRASQPWALASRSARELENALGYAPSGGWGRLLALAAGLGWFCATEDMFAPRVESDVVGGMDPQDVQLRLVESFTRQLCPPQSMAGMLVALDLHPMWGLRVAHEVRSRGKSSPEVRDHSLFPRETLATVERMVFGTIATFLSVLWQLDPEHSYPTDPMAGLFYECARSARTAIQETFTQPKNTLPVFLGADISIGKNLTDFLHADMFDAVLVPANLAQNMANGRIAIRSDVLQQARVGDLEGEEVRKWGQWLLTGHCIRNAC